MGPLEELRTAVEDAAAELRNGKPAPAVRPTLERPKKAGFGDYSTNAAMLLAPALGATPRDIAEQLAGALSGRLGERVERVEVAGPGFLNVFLAEDWFVTALEDLLAAGDGVRRRRRPRRPRRCCVEFVSANPTGPLTAASGRHAAFGDALARILELAGHSVSREYYFNDAAPRSTASASRSAPARAARSCPRTATRATTSTSWRRRSTAPPRWTPPSWRRWASTSIMTGIRATLEAYRVHFDSWFLERSLHEGEPSAVERTLALLEEQGHTYRSEGALWLRTLAVRRRQGPRARPLERRDDLLRQRRRLPRGQARARLRPHDQPARLRPPRLHRAHEGVDGGARDRPGPARDPDPPVRAHRRGRAPRLDVQAPRRLRDARRPDRGDRRRRHALLHAQPLARLDRRPRRRARQVAGEGQPRLLRAVPPRALRVDPAPGRTIPGGDVGAALELHASASAS